MAKALVLKAPGEIADPGDSPVLGDITTDLLFHYDASSLSLSNGAAVTSWPSTSGSWPGNLVSASTPAPTFVDGTVKAVSFDEGYIDSDNPAVIDNTPLTLAALVLLPAYVLNQTIISSTDPDEFAFLRVMSGGQLRVARSDASGNTLMQDSSGLVPLNQWVFVCGVFDGADSRIYVNEQKDDVDLDGSPGIMNNVRLGANAIETHVLRGLIAAACGFGRALSHSDVLTLRDLWREERGLE